MDSGLYRVWFGVRALLRMMIPPVYSLNRLARFGEREVARQPGQAVARRFLANVYFDYGRLDDARRHFLMLHSQGALTDRDRGRLAETCYRLGRFSEAVDYFDQIADRTDFSTKYRVYLAMAQVYSGRFDSGLAALEKLAEAHGTAQLYEAMGFAYCALRKPDRAVPFYERAISLDPESPRLRENLARALVLTANAHLEVGERASAVDFLTRALMQSVDTDLRCEIERVLAQSSTEDEAKSVKH